MITSPKAKAIVAALVGIVLGVLGQLANNVWVDGDAHKNLTVAVAVVTMIASTLGVFWQTNAPAPAPGG